MDTFTIDPRRVRSAGRGRSVGAQSALGRVSPTDQVLGEVLGHLADRVAARLRAARRAGRTVTVRVRFREGIERLRTAGLLDAARDMAALPDGEARHRLGHAWFRQQIACPFLERESCAIHPHRPLGCREYLVAVRSPEVPGGIGTDSRDLAA